MAEVSQSQQMAFEVQQAKSLIDRQLEVYLKSNEPLLNTLHESIAYSLFSGGKRIRPLFAFIVGELFSVPRKKLASTACAVEMIHTASLIMDDLPHMDNARLRRSKPANHMVYGQDVATLASISLLARAYQVVLEDALLSPEVKARVTARLAVVVGIDGMVGGQFVDLKFLNESVTFSTLEYIHLHKTAALFATAGEAAGIVGGASATEIGAVRSYALNLGFAYQILDDLLDSTGSDAEVGKTLRNDRANFITLFGLEKSRELAAQYTRDAIASLDLLAERSDKLVALTFMLLKRGS